MAVIAGLTPNQWVSGFNVPDAYTLNTPMVWQGGVRGQYYNPQYATAKPTPTVSGAKPASTATPGQYRGSNGELLMPQTQTMPRAKPGGGSGATPYGSAPAGRLPWQTSGGGASPYGISTSINPRPIYSPEQTAAAVNSAAADQHKAGFLPDLMKRYDRTGVSRSAGQTAAALGDAAGYNQAARRAAAQIPMEDAYANVQSILGGQVAREGEAQGLARVLLKMLGNQQDLQFGLAGAQNDLFGSGLNLANSLFN